MQTSSIEPWLDNSPRFVARSAALAAPPEASFAGDVAACRAVLKQNSRTFHAASLLLPKHVRDPASVLYGFCRLADDAVDIENGRLDAVAKLADRIARAYAGKPLPVPADRALAVVVARHGIPREIPLALIEGLEWDARGRRYETLDELMDYAARVAGTVGAMMALLMGADSPSALARACDLGVAMQLSNIARDIGEDARMGRIYLPLQWLREAGIDADAWLAQPIFTPALGAVVQRLLCTADRLYRRVGTGVAKLPLSCRPGINAARLLYAEIGREVERAGLDSVSRRAVVSSADKAVLLVRAACTLVPSRASGNAPPLRATRMLVQAAAGRRAAAPAHAATTPAWWQIGARWVALVGMFERLERRDQMRRSASPG